VLDSEPNNRGAAKWRSIYLLRESQDFKESRTALLEKQYMLGKQ
jgi:hypothetical protein